MTKSWYDHVAVLPVQAGCRYLIQWWNKEDDPIGPSHVWILWTDIHHLFEFWYLIYVYDQSEWIDLKVEGHELARMLLFYHLCNLL